MRLYLLFDTAKFPRTMMPEMNTISHSSFSHAAAVSD